MKQPKIYFIPGLGATKELFINQDKAGFNMKVIEWLPPLKNEPIEAYAKRMGEKIDLNEDFIIAGVSFGGIMAIEMSKIYKPLKTILISSIQTRSEFPFLYKLLSYVPLYRLTPRSVYQNKKFDRFFIYVMGIQTEEGKKIFIEMLRNTDIEFIEWAIEKIIQWKNKTILAATYRIHGKDDRIFPFNKVKTTNSLPGGHAIVLEDADRINDFLKTAINDSY